MLKKSILTVFFTFSVFISFSQSLSPESFRTMKVNELSNSDIIQMKNEMEKQNLNAINLEDIAISNGMKPTDFSILINRINSVKPDINESNVEVGTKLESKPIELDLISGTKDSDIFGSSIFNGGSMSFEPNLNAPTPSNYVLGIGDELQIVIYGMQELVTTPTINKEGKIAIPVVGQIFVNGLTLEAAKVSISKACSNIFTSLKSGQSKIAVSITNIRTIRITMLGVQRPGNYSVSSMSTVFNALYVAGGPDNNGSYREIELIRNNKVIKKIDIYKFLLSGDQSDNINLLDNDVIRVPVYLNRIKIEGHVKKPGIYELRSDETFNDLLKYCSGFDEAAYKANIKLIQNTDKQLKIVDLTEQEYLAYKPISGDVFKVSTILNKFENKVSIQGSVFRPDIYAFSENMSIEDLINKAEGLKEDAFKTRAQLIREKDDLTKEIVNIDLTKSNVDFKLKKNDELYISSIFDLKYAKNITITGLIKKPGDYPFIENISLYDVIIQAGGFVEGSSKVVEIASTIIKDEKIDLKEKSVIKTIEIDTSFLDQSKNILLSPYDIINVRKKPVFKNQKNVEIFGAVFYPGSYTTAYENESFLTMLERAGGLRSTAYVKGMYVLRQMDNISTSNIESSQIQIPLNYKKALRRPNSRFNLKLKVGDQIHIPNKVNTVQVFGKVAFVSENTLVPVRGVRFYLRSSGGVGKNANKKKIYIKYQNGKVKLTRNFIFRFYPRIKGGCEIHVPSKNQKEKEEVVEPESKMSVAELSIIASVVSSITGMTIAIINLLK